MLFSEIRNPRCRAEIMSFFIQTVHSYRRCGFSSLFCLHVFYDSVIIHQLLAVPIQYISVKKRYLFNASPFFYGHQGLPALWNTTSGPANQACPRSHNQGDRTSLPQFGNRKITAVNKHSNMPIFGLNSGIGKSAVVVLHVHINRSRYYKCSPSGLISMAAGLPYSVLLY